MYWNSVTKFQQTKKLSVISVKILYIIVCPAEGRKLHVAPSSKTDNVNVLLIYKRWAWMIKLPRFKNPISIVNKLQDMIFEVKNLAWYEI